MPAAKQHLVDVEALRKHLESDGSILSMAKKIGVSEWTVSQVAKRHKLSRPLWKIQRVLSKVERVWIAAVIDCEGSIVLHVPWVRNARCVQIYIRVNMVNYEIPRRLYGLCGGTIRLKWRKDKDGNRKPQWYWNITANGCRWLLPQIFPYLIEKRRRAEILIEVLNNNGKAKRMPSKKLFGLIIELRQLNHKGLKGKPPDISLLELRKERR